MDEWIEFTVYIHVSISIYLWLDKEIVLTWARACSPTKMTSLVASWSGMSEMNNPLPVRPSSPSRNGEPTKRMESDSGQYTICPFNSNPLNDIIVSKICPPRAYKLTLGHLKDYEVNFILFTRGVEPESEPESWWFLEEPELEPESFL